MYTSFMPCIPWSDSQRNILNRFDATGARQTRVLNPIQTPNGVFVIDRSNAVTYFHPRFMNSFFHVNLYVACGWIRLYVCYVRARVCVGVLFGWLFVLHVVCPAIILIYLDCLSNYSWRLRLLRQLPGALISWHWLVLQFVSALLLSWPFTDGIYWGSLTGFKALYASCGCWVLNQFVSNS